MKVFAQFTVVAAWVCDNRFGQIHHRKTYFMCSLVTILPSQNHQKVDSKSTCLSAGWTMFEAIPNYQTFGMCSDNFSRTPKKPIRTRSNPFGHVRAQHWVRVSVTVRTRTRSKRVQKPFGFSRDFPLFSFMNLKVVEKHCLGNIRTAV